MFGDVCFSDVTFAGLLQVIVVNYKTVHGRTKVVAIINNSTGSVIVINPPVVTYKLVTKVTEQKSARTFLDKFNPSGNDILSS